MKVTILSFSFKRGIPDDSTGNGNAPVAEGDQVGRMSEANEPRSGRKSPGVIDIHLENDAELVPRRFTATCGGEAAFTQFATPPSWLFRRDWTLMKVTRRGVGVPSEWIRCDIVYNCFTIRIR